MKKTLIICCTSFTVLMLAFAISDKFNFEFAVDNMLTIQAFLLTLSISLSMFLAEKLQDKFNITSPWADMVIRAILSYLIILFEGNLFGWFSLSAKSILVILPIWFPVFLLTSLAVFLTCMQYADEINKKIKGK